MSPLRVVSFGTYDLAKHPRVGIVGDGLRAHGDEVVVANAPLGFSTAERVELLRKPWTAFGFLARLLRRWGTLVRLSTSARRGGPVDAVLVGYLGHFDVLLARLLFPRTTVALDQMIFAADTARDRGITGGMKLALLDRLDRLAVRAADLVLLDTDEALDLMPAGQRHKAVVVPVGAPLAWFVAGDTVAGSVAGAVTDAAPGAPGRAGGAIRAVFFGLYTPLQGARVIGEALAELADTTDVAVTMIGSGQDHDATRAASAANGNVTWLDWVDADDLPALVAGHDICLGIFGTTPKAHRVVPNKVFQGAAAGCAIVTSDTAPQRRLFGDSACLVPPGDAHALASALRELAADRARLAALRTAARERAARFRPEAVVIPLRRRLTSPRDLPGADS